MVIRKMIKLESYYYVRVQSVSAKVKIDDTTR